MISRVLLLVLLLLLPSPSSLAAGAEWALLRDQGAMVLFRHANAPGVGDPDGFTLGDCSTQRNLDERGRAEARAIGAEFRTQGIVVGRVLSSQWCRTRETAEIAFPGRVQEASAFNSFFEDRASEPAATAEALGILRSWSGPGVLVVVTHQVNIAALTGISPRPGEGIIVRAEAGHLRVLGRLPPPGQD